MIEIIERETEIHTKTGTAEAFLYLPAGERGQRWPAIVFLTDIGGIRPAKREMARRLAAEGYCVLLPNVFYRNARPPVFDFPRVLGEERTTKRIAELAAPLTPDAMERDAADYLDFLAALDSVAAGPMGVVGHCFTGGMALRAAAARPDKISAAASFHGVRLYSDEPSSPHLLLPRIKARLYFGYAIEDKSMPPEAIEKFEKALADWGGRYESEIYQGAYHGWTALDHPAYNETQANRAFGKMAQLFAETLK